mgnify:CR=1 FL=1
MKIIDKMNNVCIISICVLNLKPLIIFLNFTRIIISFSIKFQDIYNYEKIHIKNKMNGESQLRGGISLEIFY